LLKAAYLNFANVAPPVAGESTPDSDFPAEFPVPDHLSRLNFSPSSTVGAAHRQLREVSRATIPFPTSIHSHRPSFCSLA
jgi:hypothetical protein